jgi:hypothetical protein
MADSSQQQGGDAGGEASSLDSIRPLLLLFFQKHEL